MNTAIVYTTDNEQIELLKNLTTIIRKGVIGWFYCNYLDKPRRYSSLEAFKHQFEEQAKSLSTQSIKLQSYIEVWKIKGRIC